MSLEVVRSVHGEDAEHPDIALSLHNLGSVLESKRNLDEAESHYRTSLAMERAVHGEDAEHLDIAASLNYRASVEIYTAVRGEDAECSRIAGLG